MRAPAVVASLLLLSVLGSGCKGDREKCAKAAQHFAELVFWERENAAIAKLPLEQRDTERKRKLIAFNRDLDAQLDFRVQQCVAANNDDQADCIIAAKTAAAALECAEIAKSE
jgi:urease accessory protein UreE